VSPSLDRECYHKACVHGTTIQEEAGLLTLSSKSFSSPVDPNHDQASICHQLVPRLLIKSIFCWTGSCIHKGKGLDLED
jgi:hypothetical protein